ncbi:hypothetical protein HKX48_004658 [Thoreauomyces humboldtii]|nr:hypothetical protein HKX48_004658 [Thoreauomyces humboldtii]
MAPSIGQQAPAFCTNALVDGAFRKVSLQDFRGKYVVLFFYPMDFTFVCPTEITVSGNYPRSHHVAERRLNQSLFRQSLAPPRQAFSDKASEFASLNAQVIGCSIDTVYSHLAWTQQPRNEGGIGSMDIPLLADVTKRIAHDYGVLVQDDGGPDAGVALRGTFVIDPEGILRIAHVNDLPIGRNVDEYLRLVQALAFHALHGDVCPANWQAGDATIQADPALSKAYFEAQEGDQQSAGTKRGATTDHGGSGREKRARSEQVQR